MKTPPEEFEGKLSAHREAIMLLFTLIASEPRLRRVVIPLLEQRAEVADHQEDPGAVPADGFAIQEAKAHEFQILADEISAFIEAENTSAGDG